MIKKVETQRRAGKYELAAFLFILSGIGVCFLSGTFGIIIILIGLVIYLISRFM